MLFITTNEPQFIFHLADQLLRTLISLLESSGYQVRQADSLGQLLPGLLVKETSIVNNV